MAHRPGSTARTRGLLPLVAVLTACVAAPPPPEAPEGRAAPAPAQAPAAPAAPDAPPTPDAPPAPTPPSTDVWLLDLSRHGDEWRVGAPRNLTARPGYDNQPSFTADGEAVLYTSIREDGQADVWRYDLARGTPARITTTAESEYSPTPVPTGREISVVRVEADSTQRLWAFPLGGGAPRLLLPEVRPVGYHAWADESTLALFVLGEPATLRIADLGSGQARVVAEGIGRSLHRVPGRRAISFVRKIGETEWVIEELDLATERTARLARTLPGSEDYAWTPDGVLLMASGTALYARDPRREGGWRAVADLGSAGLGTITRLAVSPQGDRLAVVAETAPSR